MRLELFFVTLTLLSLSAAGAEDDQLPHFAVKTLAGTESDGDGGPAVAARFGGIQSIALDYRGTLYVAERQYHRVRMIEPTGLTATVAGTGQQGCGPDSGDGPNTALSSPTAVAVDGVGNVYIADTGNARVRKLDRAGRLTTVIGGGNIPADENADGSPAIRLKLRSPVALLPDALGGLYVADDTAGRVYYIDKDGTLTTIAGASSWTGASGQIASATPVVRPTGLAYDPKGGLIIAENGACRYRRVFQRLISNYPADYTRSGSAFCPTGIAIDTATDKSYYLDATSGTVIQNPASGDSFRPAGAVRSVAIDRRGNVLFATESAIVRLDGTPVAGALPAAYGGADTVVESALATRLQGPYSIVRMPDGTLLVSEEEAHRIRRIAIDGTITLFSGGGQPGYCGDGSLAVLACLNRPRGMTLDRWGNLFIADSGNHAVRVVTPLGKIYTVAGNGNPGSGSDAGPAIRPILSSPSGVAINTAGELLIADTGNGLIRRLGVSGILFTLDHSFEWQRLKSPTAIAVAKDGTIFVADSAQKSVISESLDGRITVIADPQLVAPSGVAVGPNGQLWIADQQANGVFIYDGRRMTKVAGNGRGEFSGDGGEALNAGFNGPQGLVVEGLGA